MRCEHTSTHRHLLCDTYFNMKISSRANSSCHNGVFFVYNIFFLLPKMPIAKRLLPKICVIAINLWISLPPPLIPLIESSALFIFYSLDLTLFSTVLLLLFKCQTRKATAYHHRLIFPFCFLFTSSLQWRRHFILVFLHEFVCVFICV